jgi:hypothetical protein
MTCINQDSATPLHFYKKRVPLLNSRPSILQHRNIPLCYWNRESEVITHVVCPSAYCSYSCLVCNLTILYERKKLFRVHWDKQRPFSMSYPCICLEGPMKQNRTGGAPTKARIKIKLGSFSVPFNPLELNSECHRSIRSYLLFCFYRYMSN